MRIGLKNTLSIGIQSIQGSVLSREGMTVTTFLASFITCLVVTLAYVSVQFKINDMNAQWMELQSKIKLSNNYYQELLLEEQKLNQYDRVKLIVSKKMGLISPTLKHYSKAV